MATPNQTRTPKVAVVGYGRHGKDLTGEILSRITPLRYGGSTSWAALPYVAAAQGVHPQIAWERRHEKRDFWFQYCCELRTENPCFLIEKVLEQGDMVVGIRDKIELVTMQERGLVDVTVWVDANPRIITKDSTVTFGPEDCDDIIDNSGSKRDLVLACYSFCLRHGIPLRLDGATGSMDLVGDLV